MEGIDKKRNILKRKREKSLSKMFVAYMMIFGVVVIVITTVYFSIFLAGAFLDAFRPANYLDEKVKESEEFISSEKIVKNYIPDECDYVVFTQSGDIVESNVSNKEALKLKDKVEYGSRIALGNIYYRIKNTDMCQEFKEAHIFNKPTCKKCWARFYCSGGCQANNFNFNGDMHIPYEIGCEMQKKRIECAIALKSKTMDMEE